MSTRLAAVALPLPVATPYTYAIPDALGDLVLPGARVVVPLRRRELVGIVTALDVDVPPAAPRPILSAPDPEPALTPELLRLAEWMASYYGSPLGLALKVLLPAGLWGASRVVLEVPEGRMAGTGGVGGELLRWLADRGGEAPMPAAERHFRKPLWEAAERLRRAGMLRFRVDPPDVSGARLQERVVRLQGEPLTLLEREARFRRQPRRRELYEALEGLGGQVSLQHLRERLAFGDALVRALAGDGLAVLEDAPVHRDPFADLEATAPPTELSPDQRGALDQLEALPEGGRALLFGVTGSGKTLVYLEHIRRALAAGQGAIVLVPEIGLTPQTVSRVRGLFGDQVAVLHSGLTDGERADAWRALRHGERRVAVGARSAIFAPVQRLGVIVVDEEHETGYKNGESPRYHARDVAGVRARLEGAHLILGTATPSLETWTQVREGLACIRLPQRIGARPLPPVELVDLRSAPRVERTGAVPWSEVLERAVRGTLDRGEQALLFLNRRGFSAFLQCRACGTVRSCPDCSISLTLHQGPERLRCHYCGHEEARTEHCPGCGEGLERHRGFGTQQLERLLLERFPGARVARMDLDATSTKWAHHRILERVGRGEVDLLVGTQMVAKGLDFPRVTLVGVVDADVSLHLPDFRAAERTFQLLAQVAGRAGRGPLGGRVLVQTRNPEHHALRRALAHDVEGFLDEEAALRVMPPYPPHLALANMVVSGPDQAAVADATAELVTWVSGLATRHELPVEVLGPAPAPIARIKTRWRWHGVARGPGPAVGHVVRALAGRQLAAPLRLAVDRDPVSLL